jgi:UDP-N-acetylmuramoylalanine--D-glutamate ligase
VNAALQQSAWAQQLTGKTAVVVGAGKSGLAAARLLHAVGAKVRLADSGEKADKNALAEALPFAEIMVGPHAPQQFRGADWVVPSPGVRLRDIQPWLGDVPLDRVIAEMELAAGFCTQPILAVTGSNGKTTTVEMASYVLRGAGLKVFTGGNIGTPLSEFVLKGGLADALVLELSSFQLQTCRNFRPKVGVLLNVAPNHLDYHLNMEEYLSAKLRLFQAQAEEDVAVLPADLLPSLPSGFTKARIKTFKAAGRISAPFLPGAHNQENMEAVLAAVEELGVEQTQALAFIVGFRALPHRIQFIGEKHGVRFVDDSKATNLGAVAAALSAMRGPVRLLLGGVFKGGDPAELIPAMEGKVVQIGLFGGAREAFEKPLAGAFDLFHEEGLEDAVRRLFAAANPGDVILLSPATASWDQYNGYAERGEHFRKIFEALQ